MDIRVSSRPDETNGDRVSALIRDIEEAEDVLRLSLKRIAENLEEAKGIPPREFAERALMPEFEKMRKQAATALANYEHQLMLLRATAIEELVGGQGMTFTEVARRLSISRQMVARLYRSGKVQGAPTQ